MQTLMAKFLIFSMFAMSYNLVFGYGGLLSLGHAAYFGIGAYTAGLLMFHGGVTSFWIAAPLALAFSLLGGCVSVSLASGDGALLSSHYVRTWTATAEPGLEYPLVQ